MDTSEISAALAGSAGDIGKVPRDEITCGLVLLAVGVAAMPEVSGVKSTSAHQKTNVLRLIGVPGLREHSPQLRGGDPWRKLLGKLSLRWGACRTDAKKKGEFFNTLLVGGDKPRVPRDVVDVGAVTPHAAAAAPVDDRGRRGHD